MGDRTYCQVEIAASSREQLQELFDSWGFSLQDENEIAGRVCFEDSEANYGGSDCRDELDKIGIPYFGYHDAGGTYGPTLFAFDGKRFGRCCGLDGDPMCRIQDNGEPDPDTLQSARDYLEVKKAAIAAMTPAEVQP